MSWSELEKSLHSEAKGQIEKLREGFEVEVLKEEKRISKMAREAEEEIIQQAEEKAQYEAQRIHQSAQLNAKADVLVAKQREILLTKNEVVKAILNWDEAKASKLITNLLKLLPEDEGTIQAGDQHYELVVKQVKKMDVEVMKTQLKNEGGFVYKGKSAEYNLTISFLIDQLFANNRAFIAKTLFN